VAQKGTPMFGINMNKEAVIQSLIYILLSSALFAWKKYRTRKKLGAEIGTGVLVDSYIPHRIVFILTNYVLSTITMIMISLNDKFYILTAAYVLNILFFVFYSIKDLKSIWNKVFIYENGLKINYEEFYFKKHQPFEDNGLVIVKLNTRKIIQYKRTY
jgi:hypothetical protein